MRISRLRINQRGDTIVEVMLALAVLGAVLGGAYVVTSRNTITNRDSQERMHAVKVAESQLERLRAAAGANPSVFAQTDFCIGTDNMPKPSGSASCTVSSSGVAPVGGELGYRIRITRDAYIQVGSDSQAGTRFNVRIEWDAAQHTGSGIAQLDYLYEVYK